MLPLAIAGPPRENSNFRRRTHRWRAAALSHNSNVLGDDGEHLACHPNMGDRDYTF
jgi:hypothetical protein